MLRFGVTEREAGGGRRRLEADGEEDGLFFGMFGGVGHGVERRVDDLDAGAAAARLG